MEISHTRRILNAILYYLMGLASRPNAIHLNSTSYFLISKLLKELLPAYHGLQIEFPSLL